MTRFLAILGLLPLTAVSGTLLYDNSGSGVGSFTPLSTSFKCNSFSTDASSYTDLSISLLLSASSLSASAPTANIYVFSVDASAPASAPAPYFCGGAHGNVSPSSSVFSAVNVPTNVTVSLSSLTLSPATMYWLCASNAALGEGVNWAQTGGGGGGGGEAEQQQSEFNFVENADNSASLLSNAVAAPFYMKIVGSSVGPVDLFNNLGASVVSSYTAGYSLNAFGAKLETAAQTSGTFLGQSFMTDNVVVFETRVYSLTVTLSGYNTGANTQKTDVLLFSDNNDAPGSVLAAFNSLIASNYATSDSHISLPTISVTLSPRTRYWLVVRSISSATASPFAWDVAAGAPGNTNDAYYAGQTQQANKGTFIMQMNVKAYSGPLALSTVLFETPNCDTTQALHNLISSATPSGLCIPASNAAPAFSSNAITFYKVLCLSNGGFQVLTYSSPDPCLTTDGGVYSVLDTYSGTAAVNGVCVQDSYTTNSAIVVCSA